MGMPGPQMVDLVGKAVTRKHAGDWVGFELKTSAENNVGLSKRQSWGSDRYIRDVLSKAGSILDVPFWKGNDDRKLFAQTIIREMGRKAIDGYVIRSAYVNSAKPKVSVVGW